MWQPPRRIPPPLLEEVNPLVDETIKDDVIRPSKSPRASPIALVKESGDSLRLCIDCRKLNGVTKKDAFPLPHINDLLNSLHGSKRFFTPDLKSGYGRVEVVGTDKEKTAFMVPNGIYEFQTMLFGPCNAAATFQRLIQTALMRFFPKHCINYHDDILAFGKYMQEHNANLKLVLDCLRDAELTLIPKKYHLLQRSRSKWENENDEVSKELKRIFCPAPTLILPNFENNTLPFVLDTNGSDVAVGGVLSQRDKGGREHVIAYASIRLNKKMRQKSATELELLAIFAMVRHFKQYLMAKQIIVRTGHQALTWLRITKEIDHLAVH
ncbi:Transposon Tf2-9 polyprotein [Taenia solium]|eukprot:TsM_000961400 transcript=TsM_000961400 gene=TsM_000961400